MFSLGRDFNAYLQAGAGTQRINLKAADGVTFFVFGATSGNVTLTEANAATGGTSQVLPRIDRYWSQTNGVWTRTTQAAGSTFALSSGPALWCFEVETSMLDDGFSYVYANHATAQVLMLPRGLEQQRNPTFLADIRA